MEAQYSTKRLLALRKLTRAIAELLRNQLSEYLGTLAPLLRPRTVLGEYIGGSARDLIKAPEKAFQDLQRIYQAAATPYGLAAELTPPFNNVSSTWEFTPLEYLHTARNEPGSKNIAVTSPLKWVLFYSGFPLSRLRELLAARSRDEKELSDFMLHYSILQLVIYRQPGIGKMLEALRFPMSVMRLPEFGELPVICIASAVTTARPPDAVLIESTELSGQDAFEEVVDQETIRNLRDPLREQLVEVARGHGEKV